MFICFLLYISQIQASGSPKDLFPLSEVKKWATEDLNKTITWLASQEEKV